MKKQSCEEFVWFVPICVQGRWYCSSQLPLPGGELYSPPDNIGLPVRLALINDMWVEVTYATAKYRFEEPLCCSDITFCFLPQGWYDPDRWRLRFSLDHRVKHTHIPELQPPVSATFHFCRNIWSQYGNMLMSDKTKWWVQECFYIIFSQLLNHFIF